MSNNIHYFPGKGSGNGSGGEPPMNDQLTQRVQHLERDVGEIKVTLARLEGRFDTIDAKFDAINTKLDTFATKADMAETKVSMIQWGVGTVIAAGALVFAIMRFLPAAS